VSESPSFRARTCILPLRINSSSAVITAALFVLAPEICMASFNKASGTSKVVFIWKYLSEYMYISSCFYGRQILSGEGEEKRSRLSSSQISHWSEAPKVPTANFDALTSLINVL